MAETCKQCKTNLRIAHSLVFAAKLSIPSVATLFAIIGWGADGDGSVLSAALIGVALGCFGCCLLLFAAIPFFIESSAHLCSEDMK